MSSSALAVSLHTERLLSILNERPPGPREPLRVLVVDHEPTAADMLRLYAVRAGAEILFASTVDGARELLAATPVALILCNPAVAREEQRTFFDQVVEHATTVGTGVVAFSTPGAALDQADLYDAGADAVLAHPIDGSALVALVGSSLRKIAIHRGRMLQDPVTGQPNIAVLRGAFQRASSLAAREHEPLALLAVHAAALRDIRRDRGIPAADAMLRQLAGYIADALRKSDLLARGGGNSFLLLLPNTSRSGAMRVIEKLHDRLERAVLGQDTLAGTDLLLSAGIAEATPGVTFEDALEAAYSDLQPVWSSIERAYVEDFAQPVHRKHRVLLAEDDALTASIIRHRLERMGAEVVHVLDGSALLSVAAETDASLLILDVKMPYVDGFEALRRLRSIRSLRDVPVMLVTSMGNEEDIARGFELGADDYLVKPFSPIELQARVQRLLRRGR